MIQYQLRRYAIHEGQMERFLSIWRKNIVPARERAGFQIVAAYVNRDKHEFVWLLHWDQQVQPAEAEKIFQASPERQAVLQELHATIAAMDNVELEQVPVHELAG